MPWPIYPWDSGPASTVEEDRWVSRPIWMGGRKENILSPPGLEPQTIQCGASHYFSCIK